MYQAPEHLNQHAKHSRVAGSWNSKIEKSHASEEAGVKKIWDNSSTTQESKQWTSFKLSEVITSKS